MEEEGWPFVSPLRLLLVLDEEYHPSRISSQSTFVAFVGDEAPQERRVETLLRCDLPSELV